MNATSLWVTVFATGSTAEGRLASDHLPGGHSMVGHCDSMLELGSLQELELDRPVDTIEQGTTRAEHDRVGITGRDRARVELAALTACPGF
ncbi:MAG: hypothetical protein M3N43_00725 [Actinomycetota bacterium]|nr:hypothetical protein [Actinomycetota bacterium]